MIPERQEGIGKALTSLEVDGQQNSIPLCLVSIF